MLAITGGKGGCGKTTTALGLARVLASDGARPLVVDTDTDMPDLHHVGDVPRRPSMDRLCSGASLGAVTKTADRLPGVELLTAGRRDAVGRGLRAATNWRGPVLVDCPPGLGPDAVDPVRAADAALVVTTARPTAIEDGAQTVRAARRVGTEPVGVVLVGDAPGRGPDAVAGCRVLARAPTSGDPFSDEDVARAWARAARSVASHFGSRPDGESGVSRRRQPQAVGGEH